MNKDYEEIIKKEFYDCLPSSSFYEGDFLFLLEDNIRAKYGFFSERMRTFRKLRKEIEQGRNKLLRISITPEWMENISLGKNIYTYRFGVFFWWAFLLSIFLIVLSKVLNCSFVNLHVLIFFVNLLCAHEIKNFFIGKDVYIQGGGAKAEAGNAYIRFLALILYFSMLALVFIILLNYPQELFDLNKV